MQMPGTSDSTQKVHLQEGMGAWMWWSLLGRDRGAESHMFPIYVPHPLHSPGSTHPFFLALASLHIGWALQ